MWTVSVPWTRQDSSKQLYNGPALIKFYASSETACEQRSEEEAQGIYNAALRFLQSHLVLSDFFLHKLASEGGKDDLQLWALRPKFHTFYHQALECLQRRMNTRHTHCFTDEDSMRWLKLCARHAPDSTFEGFILRKSRLRLKITQCGVNNLNMSSKHRSRR